MAQGYSSVLNMNEPVDIRTPICLYYTAVQLDVMAYVCYGDQMLLATGQLKKHLKLFTKMRNCSRVLFKLMNDYKHNKQE